MFDVIAVEKRLKLVGVVRWPIIAIELVGNSMHATVSL